MVLTFFVCVCTHTVHDMYHKHNVVELIYLQKHSDFETQDGYITNKALAFNPLIPVLSSYPSGFLFSPMKRHVGFY